jgi:tRNA-specific 2-thiouridylase
MRALALFSGGLDSLLAVKLITMQGIDVTALFFDTGFGSIGDKKEYLENALAQVGAKLEIVDIKEQFIQDILFSPKYGYGKNFNPCIDCHGNMVRVAKELMSKYDASFIISGEVLGQRPMSQRSEAMKQVEKLSTIDGLLLRPLSAKLMEQTKPELEKWVDREGLLDISGRGRERQIALAKEFGIANYEAPAGGCLLTDPNFSIKMKDFLEYDKDFTIADIDVLKYGRSFRLPQGAKLVVSRNKDENQAIRDIVNPKFITIPLRGITGPMALLAKSATEEERELAVKIILVYSKTEKDKEYTVMVDDKEYKTTPYESKEKAREEYMLNLN